MKTARAIFSLLSRRERRQVYVLFVGLTVLGLIEAAGVASIAPLLTVVTDPTVVDLDGVIGRVYRAGGFDNPTNFAIALSAALLAAVILRNAFGASITYLLLRFAGARTASFSSQVLKRYLDEPYGFFITRNSTDLAKNILAESNAFVAQLLVPLIQIFSNLVVGLFILALLLYLDPVLALVVGSLLGGAYGIIYLFVRRKLHSIGVEQVEWNSQRYKATIEALQGIKELKLLGRESPALQRFARPSERFARGSVTAMTISALPRYALETVAIGGVLAVVIYLLVTGSDILAALPLLGLFAFATYRLMPALSHVFTAVGSIRFGRATLDLLLRDLTISPEELEDIEARSSVQPLQVQRDVQLRGVSFSYPDAPEPVVRDLDLSISVGEFVAIVGPTGSGKSTIVDLLVGLLRPQEGHLVVDDRALSDTEVIGWQRSIGYVPQAIYLSDASVEQNIAFGVPSDEIDHDKVRWAAGIAHAAPFVEEMPLGYETIVGEDGIRLSGGQRQRLGIARALYVDPQLLVLDEATNALDDATQAAVVTAIRDAGPRTILMVTHRSSLVELSDRVIDLADMTP